MRPLAGGRDILGPVPERPAPPAPVPPDLDELVRDAGFRDPEAAGRRVRELFADPGEMLALARLSGVLRDSLAASPDPDAALLQLSRLVETRGSRLQLYRTFLEHPAWLDRFVHVVASSRYLADILIRNPEHLDLLADPARLSRPSPARELRRRMAQAARLHREAEAKLDALRRAHRREALRIGAADLLGLLDVETVTAQLSDLADAFAAGCLAAAAPAWRKSGLIVLALGKWGGGELNYSSDVDVVFLAPRAADLGPATEAAQRLVRALGERTSEGVVYRVDLRLRPYGSEGELVTTTRAFATYLAGRAQPAERQAMLKARPAAGAVEAGSRFLRRAVPALLADGASARTQVRRLKERIERQLVDRGQKDGHVKLAPGGIRDVEFLVQALQLEAGRGRPRILGGNTLAAIRALEREELLAADDAHVLRDAYVFLRAVENRMQLMENQQVHRLPRKEEDLERLARTLGFAPPRAPDRLLDAYDARSRRVRACFDRLLSRAGAPPPGRGSAALAPLRERLDPAALARCQDLLDRPGDLGVDVQRHDASRRTVTVAASPRDGLLPLVSGLFAARGIDVRSGDFLRLRPGRKSLAVFEVAVPDGFRGDLEAELRALASLDPDAARARIVEELGRGPRRAAAGGPLLPVRIEVANEPGGRETELHVRSSDTPGFVFELSTTLEALDLVLERAVIRTLGEEVYDTFWVTDAHGRRITRERAVEQLRAAAALVKQFTHLLPRSPDPAQALRQFAAFLRQVFDRPGWTAELRAIGSASVLSTLADLMGVSRFLWEDFLLLQHENLFPVVRDAPALEVRKTRGRLERELARAGGTLEALNEWKDREMFRIDLRHITRRSNFPEFMESLSDLADVVVARAAALCGPPPGAWCLLGLGKLGGRELGIASDLDLLMVYEGGEAAPFLDFMRRFLPSIRGRREGSFGIDLRLRPHGDAGALASSLPGFRDYYREEGPARPFERLALVKLRPVAGDRGLGRVVLEARDAFVYSGRLVDRENLLHLRKRQAAELVRPGQVHAKYGPGGLVDVEYFVQASQIEAGVRAPHTLEALELLARGGRLSLSRAEELSRTYLFLRRAIDALRVVRGHATDAAIPPRESPEFGYLVRRLGAASPAALEAEVRQRMSFARSLWAR